MFRTFALASMVRLPLRSAAKLPRPASSVLPRFPRFSRPFLLSTGAILRHVVLDVTGRLLCKWVYRVPEENLTPTSVDFHSPSKSTASRSFPDGSSTGPPLAVTPVVLATTPFQVPEPDLHCALPSFHCFLHPLSIPCPHGELRLVARHHQTGSSLHCWPGPLRRLTKR